MYKYNIICVKQLANNAPMCSTLREAIMHYKNASEAWQLKVVKEYQCKTADYFKILDYLHNTHTGIAKGQAPYIGFYAENMPKLICDEHKEIIQNNLATHFGDYLDELTDEEVTLLSSIEYLLVRSESINETST